MKTTVSMSLLTLIVFLGLPPDDAGAQESSSPTILHACYVPATGIVYRIKGPDLADECRSPRHVEFSWTDGLPEHDHGNLEGLSDDDHPEYVREGEAAGGDLGEAYPDPSVVGLRGNALSDAAPANGQILGWDGAASEWTPVAAPSGGVTDHGALGGLADDDHPHYLLADGARGLTGNLGMGGNKLTNLAAATDPGDAVRFEQAVKNGGAAGGDLAGAFPDPSVAALRGHALSSTTPSDGQVLTWSDGSTTWEPQTAPSGGVTDHGDLTGLGDDDHGQYVLVDGVRDATDGFAVTGILGTGAIPAEGAGTRIMWYPGKAAFRAGRVMGDEWDDANIGRGSTAMGHNATASASNTRALGSGTTASGLSSTAIGVGTTASGSISTAMGQNTIASGSFSTALGSGTTASGSRATAVGNETTASGLAATAMGTVTTASGRHATAMGRRTIAQAFASLVIGRFNRRVGDRTSWRGSDPLFVAGNGTGTTRSNALTLRKNGDLIISGTLTESSDARLKTGIEPLGAALEGLLSIRPVRFRFRDGTGHPTDAQIGLIAQEVRDVFPELVTADSRGQLSLAYPKLTAVLLEGLQEQQAQIEARDEVLDELRLQTERLEARNERMGERLERLEQALRQLQSRAEVRQRR